MPTRVSLSKESSKSNAPRRSPASESGAKYFGSEEPELFIPPKFSWSFGEIQTSAPGESGSSPSDNSPRGSTGWRTVAPPVVHEALRSPGQPLDPATRTFFERRFRQPFGDVTVHAGPRAARSARAVNAHAYTVGHRIVFGAGQYSPRTAAGRRLLAHELTHVVQQRSAQPAAETLAIGDSSDSLEQEAESAVTKPSPLQVERLQRVSVWQKIIRFFGAEGSFENDELQEYLKFLDTYKKIEDHYDSDNKAREVVRRWKAGRKGYQLSVDRKVLLLREMLSGWTWNADQEGILSILAGSTDVELSGILRQIPVQDMHKKMSDENLVQFDFIIAQYTRRNSDRLAGTQAVTPEQHLLTETVLNPGSTLEEAPKKKPEPKSEKKEKEKEEPDKKEPEKEEAPPPPPVFKDAPAMTGLSPDPEHNVQGQFEKEMTAAIKKYLHTRGESFRADKKAGHVFPADKARQIGVVAQKSTEEYFGPHIQVASHAPTDKYHPGSFDVASEIHSQAEVPIALEATDGHPGRLQWMQYWMAQDVGAPILKKFNCVTTRSPDKEEFARVRTVLASSPALQADIDDTIHGWPAEASGGINLGLLRDTSTQDKERQVRWDIYTTMLHEMMHILQHPNYVRTYTLFTGSAQEVLKEGMADVMRRDLWDGPGQLKKRLATENYNATRAEIEGAKYDYQEDLVVYHRDYPIATEARKIVDGDGKRKGVGMANARAAFFLGHTDLLGIGEGTRGVAAGLAGIGNYKADDARDAEIVVAQAGDTLDVIRARTGASPTGILDEKTRKPFAPGAAVPAGTRLRVPGIRYVYSIEADTLSSVASQNKVDARQLAISNNLPAGTKDDHTFPAGTRLLIPIHRQSP